jgi:hypothetical protein
VTVYVDDQKVPGKAGQRQESKMTALYSRMWSPSAEEMEAMAEEIGAPEAWRRGDHFVVSSGKRKHAVWRGARQISAARMDRMLRQSRQTV